MHTDNASVQTLIRLIDERKAEIERLRDSNAKLLAALRGCLLEVEQGAHGLDPNEWPATHDGEPDPLFALMGRSREAIALAEKGQTT